MTTAVHDDLRTTLSTLLESGTDTNPALAALLHDYAAYHRVLVILGGLILVAVLVATVACWRRYRSARSAAGARFERRTYFWFTALGVGVVLFFALVVAANVSNVLDARHGFAGALGLLGTPRPGSSAADLQESFTTWLQSGTSAVPAEVTQAIDDRLSWQRPKAIICSVLLVGFVVLTAYVWRGLIRRSRARQGRRRAGEKLMLLGGLASAAVSLLLVLMVLGNTQGSIAPVSLTLFFG